jgi:hypothetical protein
MTQKDPLAELPWPAATVAPSDECARAIRGACTRDLCPARRMSTAARAGVTLALSVLLLGFYTWFAATNQRLTGVASTMLYGATGWLGAQAVLVFLTLVRPPGKRGPALLRIALLAGIPLVFMAYLAFTSTERFGLAQFTQAYPAGHAIGCGLLALAFGAIVAGGAMVAWRKTDPHSPGLSGAAIGMVGGLASGAGINVACPSHEALHVCFAHGLIVFVLAIAGFGVGRRLLSP